MAGHRLPDAMVMIAGAADRACKWPCTAGITTSLQQATELIYRE
jgi:hypothetical protein